MCDVLYLRSHTDAWSLVMNREMRDAPSKRISLCLSQAVLRGNVPVQLSDGDRQLEQ